MVSDWASMITVGRVIRPHGHRGNVVVQPETDFGAERFSEGAVVFMAGPDGVVPLTVTASREFDGRWIVGFDRIGTMNDAETLRGLELRIAAADLHALGAGQFYVHDLVGCGVETVDGTKVGIVGGVMMATAVPVLEVASEAGEVLVPFVDAICRRVDVAGRVIVIDPPAGLVERAPATEPCDRNNDGR